LAREPARTSETNPLGHSETMVHDPLHGLVTSRTGPNGLTTAWTYDAFGRVLTETRADGNQTTTTRTTCGGGCPANGEYFITTDTDGAPPATVYKDMLNRNLRVETVALDGQLVRVDTQYDALGRVDAKSEPYFSGGTPIWTTVQYDILGRPTLTTNPDGSTQSMVYNGLERVSGAVGTQISGEFAAAARIATGAVIGGFAAPALNRTSCPRLVSSAAPARPVPSSARAARWLRPAPRRDCAPRAG
jgi:YD repeat-containing protein